MKYIKAPKPKIKIMNFRIDNDLKRRFMRKCREAKAPSSLVIRALILEFVMDEAA